MGEPLLEAAQLVGLWQSQAWSPDRPSFYEQVPSPGAVRLAFTYLL